jgi:site-specific recombinase XerD
VFMPQRYIRTVMETSQPTGSKGLTDAAVIELWLRRQRSSLTRSVYRRDMARLGTWSDKTLSETDPLDLERFAEMLAGSGLAPISQGRTLAAIRSFFRFAERIGFCRNIAAGLELPRSEPALSERIIPQEDVRGMIELEPDQRNRVLLAILYAAGLRVSEACGLRWRNLQPRGDAGQILVHGKGGRTRVVLLPPGVWVQLLGLRATAGLDAPVFASRSRKPLERSRVTRIVRQASERAGIAANVSTHWLRHAHASHALDRGAPVHLVQATLGHRSVATTSRYLHARPGESSAGYLGVY